MFIPYNVDVPMRRYPIANWVLIAVTCAISLYILFSRDEELWQKWALYRGENFHFFNLLSHTFVHAGILHLVGNMLFLFVFGNAINAKLGHLQFLALYFAAGIVAGLAWIALAPSQVEIIPGLMVNMDVPVVGASGAIMGIVGAFLMLYPRNNVSIFWIFSIRGGSFEMPAGAVIAIYAALDLWGALRQAAGGVAYISHVAGTAFGAAIAATLIFMGWVSSVDGEENIFEVFGWKTRAASSPAVLPVTVPAVTRTYIIHGQDRSSGFSTSFTIKARTEAEARTQAEKDDLVVQRVEVMP